VGTARALDAVRAAEAAGFERRADFYHPLAACFLSKPEERAVYVAEGALELEGERLAAGTMAVLRPGAPARVRAAEATRLAVIGGAPLAGERHLWWNLVSSSRERLRQAAGDWKHGRFPPVPGDDAFIPLPER